MYHFGSLFNMSKMCLLCFYQFHSIGGCNLIKVKNKQNLSHNSQHHYIKRLLYTCTLIEYILINILFKYPMVWINNNNLKRSVKKNSQTILLRNIRLYLDKTLNSTVPLFQSPVKLTNKKSTSNRDNYQYTCITILNARTSLNLYLLLRVVLYYSQTPGLHISAQSMTNCNCMLWLFTIIISQ